VESVVFRAADGQKDEVVLLPLLDADVARGVLDIAAGLTEFGRSGDAVILEDRVELGLGRVPNLLLEPADRIVLEDYGRVLGGYPLLLVQ